MGHDHNHAHHHHQPVEITSVNTAFIVGISLNLLFVIIEVITGLYIHSLSLLSDAGHNLADVGSLALSLLAFRLLKVKANDKYTYGYRKTTILTALLNAVVLLVSIGAIAYEAIHRLMDPEPLPGKTIAIVAGIGIIINGVTAMMFMSNKEKDLNIRSAYLHLLSDALVSVGLVIAGIMIFFTNWYWLDPVLSIVIAVVILLGTWNLLKESLRLSLDGVPKDIDLQKIKEETLKIKDIQGIHHLHIWAISTTQNAMTAHLVLNSSISKPEEQAIKNNFRHKMEHMNIQHVTVETEWTDEDCKAKDC